MRHIEFAKALDRRLVVATAFFLCLIAGARMFICSADDASLQDATGKWLRPETKHLCGS